MVEEKVTKGPVAEKPDDFEHEFETSSQVLPSDKIGSASALEDDAHTKALTRKLLWKLDTRYGFPNSAASLYGTLSS